MFDAKFHSEENVKVGGKGDVFFFVLLSHS